MGRWISFACFLAALAACGGGGPGGAGEDQPEFHAAELAAEVDNPWFPLVPGTTKFYESEGEQGAETVESFVSHAPREIAGARCAVVVERVRRDGALVSETFRYFGQDPAGNVWCVGEDRVDLDDGSLAAGSWRHGEFGAHAGIVMFADPRTGDAWRSASPAGADPAEEEVVQTDVPVALPDGGATTGLVTRERTLRGAGVGESRTYGSGVGLVRVDPDSGPETELTTLADDTLPDIDPARFTADVTNPWFPLPPGTTFHYAGEVEDGFLAFDMRVTRDVRLVMGVECRVVHVREYLDGELIEETYDWYAQDLDGNVWYFGEDATEYEAGVPVSTGDSWEAGIGGAMPGIKMKSHPRVGDTHRQEYLAGELLDMAEVLARDVPVTLENGETHVCLVTREWNPAEPEDGDEIKSWAPGAGLVRETAEDGSEAMELVRISVEE